MKTFAKSSPKGDPIETASVCLHILSLNVNAVFNLTKANNEKVIKGCTFKNFDKLFEK